MQDRETLRRTLVELLETDTGVQYPNLDDVTKLREGLGLDSVDVVSLVSQIERQFRIRLSHQELEALVTVGDLLNLIQNKIANPEQPRHAA
jgi:acyl carrier protein